MMANKLLRTELIIAYNGANISRDIAPDLLSFTYNDNEHGQVDDIDLTLADPSGKWLRDWMPTLGDKITAHIQKGVEALYCGTFKVDEFEVSGQAGIATFKAVSVPADKNIRKQKKSRAWENFYLKDIADDIAANADLKLTYSAKHNPLFDRRSQENQSDLEFLQKLCENEGLNLKVTDDQLVIFSSEELETRDPIADLIFGTDLIKAWRFRKQNHSAYSECTIKYNNPRTGKLIEYTYKDEFIKDGKTLKLNQRAESIADAERIAKAKLREANKDAQEGTVDLVGTTKFVAGEVVNVIGFGSFDGRYWIKKTTHSISSGYSTSIEISNIRRDEEELEAKEENAQEAKRKKEERAAAKLKAEKSKKRKVIK